MPDTTLVKVSSNGLVTLPKKFVHASVLTKGIT